MELLPLLFFMLLFALTTCGCNTVQQHTDDLHEAAAVTLLHAVLYLM